MLIYSSFYSLLTRIYKENFSNNRDNPSRRIVKLRIRQINHKRQNSYKQDSIIHIPHTNLYQI